MVRMSSSKAVEGTRFSPHGFMVEIGKLSWICDTISFVAVVYDVTSSGPETVEAAALDLSWGPVMSGSLCRIRTPKNNRVPTGSKISKI